jgi:hypothetical protein
MSLEAIWRNIYTIEFSQNLYDDLVSPGNEVILQALDNATSAIDHSQPGKNRIFQYGQSQDTIACFDPKYYAESRFSKGDFGVFYGALDEATSIAEIMDMHYRRFRTNMANAKEETVIVDRKMFVCHLSGQNCTDIRPLIKTFPDLIADSHDFCHSVGDIAKSTRLDFLVTKSVRRPEGECVAAFNADCILGEKYQYYFRLVYKKNSNPEAFKVSKIDLL